MIPSDDSRKDQSSPAGPSGRVGLDSRRLRYFGVRWLLGGVAAILALSELQYLDPLGALFGPPSRDWLIYHDAALRWLGGGSYFLPSQLDGPYPMVPGVVLYPPAALALFVPFALLPSAFWLGLPIVISALALLKLRPAAWTWPILMALTIWPTLPEWRFGNPIIWTATLLFGWAAWGWPTSLIWLQPTMFPFALIGIRSRRWWGGLAILAVLSLAMLPLSLTWVQIMWDMQGSRGVFYGAIGWFVCALPLVAWLGSKRSAHWRLACVAITRRLDRPTRRRRRFLVLQEHQGHGL